MNCGTAGGAGHPFGLRNMSVGRAHLAVTGLQRHVSAPILHNQKPCREILVIESAVLHGEPVETDDRLQ